jgi:hypothetical protein
MNDRLDVDRILERMVDNGELEVWQPPFTGIKLYRMKDQKHWFTRGQIEEVLKAYPST